MGTLFLTFVLRQRAWFETMVCFHSGPEANAVTEQVIISAAAQD